MLIIGLPDKMGNKNLFYWYLMSGKPFPYFIGQNELIIAF